MPKSSRHASVRTPRASEIILPHRFAPRAYQLPVLRALQTWCKRAIIIWHRKAGKDLLSLVFTITMMVQRPGLYLHLFPDGVEARRTIWDAYTIDGVPFLDFFPPEIVIEKNETEMSVKTIAQNGGSSIYQLVGTDNFDRLRGPNPVGCVFSEYSYQNPQAWEILAPVLLANGGWSIFPYTPNGRGHGFDLYRQALADPQWFTEILTIEQTRKDAPGEDGGQVITPEIIEAERRRGVDEEFIQQEYFCSFEGTKVGSYYGDALRRAREQGRIGQVPWDPAYPVETWTDLGVGSHLAIWCVQCVGPQVRVLKFFQGRGSDTIVELAKALKEWPYVIEVHYWPHDGGTTQMGTGRTLQDMAEGLGIRPIELAKKGDVEEGIVAVRALLERCWFDEANCRQGLDALAAYQRAWDPKGQTWRSNPKHDWASHPADAFRTGAVCTRGGMPLEAKPVTVITDFDPRETFAPWGMR